MKFFCPEFADGQTIPANYTCQGDDFSPALCLEQLPEKTQSILVVVDDPDSSDKPWLHWLVWNIPGNTEYIKEAEVPAGSCQGTNDFGHIGWGGPCPQRGLHHYRFTAYALDIMLSLPEGSIWRDVEEALFDHILDKSSFSGTYSLS